jgi:RNA polymerase sigma factor (sigma-70 family)
VIETPDQCRNLLDLISNIDLEKRDEAFERLYDLLNDLLMKYLRGQFRSQGDDFHDEVAQSTWVKVLSKSTQCRGMTQASIFAWLKAIAYHTGLNLIRDDEKFEELIRQEETTNDLQGAVVVKSKRTSFFRAIEDTVFYRESVVNWLNNMTERQREVFYYRRYGLSKTEIAEKMKISNPRVTQHLKEIHRKYDSGM